MLMRELPVRYVLGVQRKDGYVGGNKYNHLYVLHLDMDIRKLWHGMPAMSKALTIANEHRASQKLGQLKLSF